MFPALFPVEMTDEELKEYEAAVKRGEMPPKEQVLADLEQQQQLKGMNSISIHVTGVVSTRVLLTSLLNLSGPPHSLPFLLLME